MRVARRRRAPERSAWRSRSRLSEAGYEVVVGSRDAERALAVARRAGRRGADERRGRPLRRSRRARDERGRNPRDGRAAARGGRRHARALRRLRAPLHAGKACFPAPTGSRSPSACRPRVEAPVVAGLHSLAARSLGGEEAPEEDALVCGDDDDAKAARARARGANHTRPRRRRRSTCQCARARRADRRAREREQALQGARRHHAHRPPVTRARFGSSACMGSRSCARATIWRPCSSRRRPQQEGSATATSSSLRRRRSRRSRAGSSPRRGRAERAGARARRPRRRPASHRGDPSGVDADRPLAASTCDRRDAGTATSAPAPASTRPTRRARACLYSSRSIRTPRPAGCASGCCELAGADVGVIVSDSFGRPWRQGTTDVALGVAGIAALRDLRGQPRCGGLRAANDADRGRGRDRVGRRARARQDRRRSGCDRARRSMRAATGAAPTW